MSTCHFPHRLLEWRLWSIIFKTSICRLSCFDIMRHKGFAGLFSRSIRPVDLENLNEQVQCRRLQSVSQEAVHELEPYTFKACSGCTDVLVSL